MDLNKIGKFIQNLRTNKNMSQNDLASSLGVTNKAVSRWENGYNLPDSELMLEIGKIFNISVDELLNGEIKDVVSEEKETVNKTFRIHWNKTVIIMSSIVLVMLISIILIINISKPKSFLESQDVLIKRGYTVIADDTFSINGIENKNGKRLIAYDDKDYAIAYFFKSKEEAKDFYKLVYNAYLFKLYTSDIYGYMNSYKLYYNLIDEPKQYSEYTEIDWSIINKNDLNLVYELLYGDMLERSFMYPMVYLPEEYKDFNEDNYLPKCYMRNNNIYFGVTRILNIIN